MRPFISGGYFHSAFGVHAKNYIHAKNQKRATLWAWAPKADARFVSITQARAINIEKPLSLPAMNRDFVNINFVNWEKHLEGGLWLVDFWAEWCTACTAQDKVYEELARLFGDKLKIGKINVSDNRLLADRFGVRNIPFLLLMKDGKIITQMPGIQSKEYLINQIKKQIQ